MNQAKELLARLRRGREIQCDLGEGLFVTLMRPTESEVSKMTKPVEGEPDKFTIHVEDEHVAAAAIGWEGFTEAAILGKDVGSSDPIPFDRELWAELASDSRLWYFTAATKMLEAIAAHNLKQAAVAKNSEPG